MKLSITEKSKKDIFISLFQLLKNCSSVITIIFNTDHIYVQGMDKAHVCLFDIKIFSSWFDKYEYSSDDKDHICVDTNIFHNVLSMNQEQHTIFIYYEGDPDTICIDLLNKTTEGKGDFNKHFRIPLVELENNLMTIPGDTEYDAEFSINSKKIQEICSQLLIFGDIMQVKCSEEKIDLSSTGVNGEMMVNIPIDDLLEYSISEGEMIDISYSLNFIQKMCITNKLASEIEFSISGNFPMRIKYKLDENSYVTFYIAPKICCDP